MEKKPPNNIASPFLRNYKFKLEDVLRNTSFKISNICGIRKNPDRFLAFHFKQCFFFVMNALVMCQHFNFIKNKCLIFEKSQYLEIQAQQGRKSLKSSCDMKDL